jgi:hypothetical protein
LADDFEHAEIHDLRFVVLELSQPMIDFRSRPDLESARCKFGLAAPETRHAHRAFDADRVLLG